MSRAIRLLFIGLGVSLGIAGTARAAPAESTAAGNFPDRPIHIVVPWAPAGLTDNFARAVAAKMGQNLNVSVVVENRSGANGMIGANYVANSAPDGYTLLMASADTNSVDPATHPKITYDALKSFEPVSMLGSQAFCVAVNPNVPAKSLAELIALARAKPGVLTFGSWGDGSVAHLGTIMLMEPAKVSMVHVPYKGVNPAMMDVMAGRVDVMLISLASAGDNFKAGKLRPLALTGKARLKVLPDVPTVAESGYPGFEVTTWYGLLAAHGTPPAVIHKLNAAARAAVASPDVNELFTRQGVLVAASTPEAMMDTMRRELAKWAAAAKTANVKLDD